MACNPTGRGRLRRLAYLFCLFLLVALLWVSLQAVMAATQDDPLVRMPGTQPSQGVALEAPNRCFNCHAGYDAAVEPGTNWMGSMMAQAARDPIFYACMAVAGQDSLWALGTPNAVDICERCHFPEGWLGGRSDPPNASAMTGSDFNGVHCDVCHRMWDPFFETTYNGTREGNDWSGYWDEAGNTGPGSGTLSQTSADATYQEDQTVATGITLFSGGAFFVSHVPRYATYAENASGQYYVDADSSKRASFADAAPRHTWFYSRHHKSKYFCGTCHDVSNPALANLGLSGLPDQSGGSDLITEQYSASRYFHVERTFSEFLLSAYGQPGGAATNADFQAQGAPTILWASKCQDCHLHDVVGVACNKNNAPLRPTESTEHPSSGLPLHDMTGGNVWISRILASLDPNGPVYDPVNAQLLGQGAATLTLDLTAGETPVNHGAELLAGSQRAALQLHLAATLKNLSYDPGTGVVSFRIQNNTGHKLPSGFPEGRRIWVNIRAYTGQTLLYEVNPYDYTVGTLKGHAGTTLGPNEAVDDALVYEVHPRSDLTGEEQTFHFVLATGRSKDNRIPPKGFDIANAAVRLCQPVWEGADDPGYFTAAEYAGGYDDVSVNLPASLGADHVEVELYYQGTSREYVAFLRDEINGTGATLPANGSDPYVIQTDPFFAQLKAWGDTIWELWRHNHGLDGVGTPQEGITPFEMAEASVNVTVENPVPVLDALLAPSSLPAAATSFSLNALGSDFAPGVVLRWNGADYATTRLSSTQLVATIPGSNIASGTSAQITVFNPTPGGGLSNALTYSYTPVPGLALSAVSLVPVSAANGVRGPAVSVQGAGFLPGAVVEWNGTVLPTRYLSGARLLAPVPAAALARHAATRVRVVNPDGSASNVLLVSLQARSAPARKSTRSPGRKTLPRE